MQRFVRVHPVLAGLAAGVLVAAAAAPEARAERWLPIGARPTSLGGAGVASTEDATSIYWSPASLSFLPLNRPPYPSVSRERLDKAAQDAKEGVGGKLSPEDEEKIRDEGPDAPDENKGRWTGYDAFQVEIAVNGELKLTGDIVHRLDLMDKLVKQSDIQGAAARASTTPPTVTQQDFRNLVSFYDQLTGLNQGGDAFGDVGGGLFMRYKWFGLGIYSNTYVGLRPHVDFQQGVGFSDSATVDQIDQQLRASGAAIPPPSTPAGQRLQAQLVNAGISANSAADIAGLAEQSGVDLNNQDLQDALRLATVASGSGAGNGIRSNTSGAAITSLSTQELALTLAIPLSTEIGLPLDPDTIGIGIVPKLMHGITAFEDVRATDVLLGNLTFADSSRHFFNSRQESWKFGLDAGVTIQPAQWLRFGVTGRNLNDPKFKFKDIPGEFELRHQVRAGVAIRPIPSIELTADGDLLANHSSALPGMRSRQVGGGIEWNPDWRLFGFAIRAGIYDDLEDARKGFNPVLTAGFGFKLAVVTINVAGAVSLHQEDFRDQRVPTEGGVAADLGLTW